jgi:hypothetical protein
MTTPLTAEQREELRDSLARRIRKEMTLSGAMLLPLLDAADRAEDLERELESVRAELDSATTRGRELVEEAEQRAEELEARVKVLEGLLGLALRWSVGLPRHMDERIRKALAQRQPEGERR